jgi:hypothetical protein
MKLTEAEIAQVNLFLRMITIGRIESIGNIVKQREKEENLLIDIIVKMYVDTFSNEVRFWKSKQDSLNIR